MSKWSEDTGVQTALKAWAKEGMTALEVSSLIAKQFGYTVTRNAILGYSSRNGISFGGKRGPKPAPARAPIRTEQREEPKRDPIVAPKPVKKIEPPKPEPIIEPAIEPPRATAPVIPIAIPVEQEPAFSADPGGVFRLFRDGEKSIQLPSWKTCRWIDGDIRDRSAVMCASPRDGESSYCAHHRERSGQKTRYVSTFKETRKPGRFQWSR